MYISRLPLLSVLMLLLAAAGGCDSDESTPDGGGDAGGTGGEVGQGGDTSGGDAEPDGPGDTDRSWYKLHIETQDGLTYDLDRDITDSGIAFSFGSTHIAPAVSFSVSESVTSPATIAIVLNFGIVVGSTDNPVQCDGAKTYDFGGPPPEVDVQVQGLRYISSIEGSTGAMEITDWSATTGDSFAGSFEGRLLQETDKADKRWIDVEGSFHFILPSKAQGQ